MKYSIFIALILGFILKSFAAPSTVSLTVDSAAKGKAISTDFIGLSFETASLHDGSKGYDPRGYFFSATNTQLVTLFHNLGIESLRIGGNSVDGSYVSSTNDIDSFFGFVRVSGVKVIFSLNLTGNNLRQDSSLAQYLWRHQRTNLISLAIGNEPNEYRVNGHDPLVTNYQSWFAAWSSLATAVTSAVPDVRLDGPDTDDAAIPWAANFARAEQGSANVSCILHHFKPLKSAKGKTQEQLSAGELSPTLDISNYPACYNRIGAMARSNGFSYRFTEFNDYVAPIKTELRDYSFAAALFALDALHWWAAHDCSSVHFHTGIHGFHADFFVDSDGNYQLYPISYGIAAFNVSGHGYVEPLKMANSDGLNLTAYAVRNGADICVTIINRENGKSARNAAVSIAAHGLAIGNVAAMFLVQSNEDVTATNGVTLGGVTISGAAPWHGQWTALGGLTNGECQMMVPAGSAAIVKISER